MSVNSVVRSLALLLLPFAATAQSSVLLDRVRPGTWRATYHLAAPATALRFERPASFFRERAWTIVTSGYHLTRDSGAQLLRLDSGATPQRTITMEFPEYTTNLPAEYEFFQRFTDGAVSIYTGHLFVTPIAGDREQPPLRTVIVTPPPANHLIVRGNIRTSRTVVSDSAGEGTYIYIGRARPIATPDVVAVVDPGMPAWLVSLFNDEIPRLFAEYRRRFGVALPWKPLVLFGFDDSASPGLSSGGGTLTSLVNLELTGVAWRTETPAAREQAAALLAHEAAHLWNGHVARNTDQNSGSWMHEGGADWAATEMLRDLGLIDASRYRIIREQALDRCARAVSTGSIATAMQRNSPHDVYDCGVVLGIWTDALVHADDSRAGGFAFWHELIGSAAAADGSYDQLRYFAVLAAHHVPDSVIARMRAFIASRDSMSIAIEGLQRAGVAVTAGTGVPPADIQQQLARSAVEQLMSAACRRVNMYNTIPIRTGSVPGCEPFAQTHLIVAIDGHAVVDDGAAGYEAVRAACAAGSAVPLQDSSGVAIASVPCSRKVPAPPAWYRLP